MDCVMTPHLARRNAPLIKRALTPQLIDFLERRPAITVEAVAAVNYLPTANEGAAS
jgi:hypothetical protein